jgi:hypothetical protein
MGHMGKRAAKGQRLIFRVIFGDSSDDRFTGKWIVKVNKCIDGWTVDGPFKTKAAAIRRAFKHARENSPAIVRLFSADGHMQTESEW